MKFALACIPALVVVPECAAQSATAPSAAQQWVLVRKDDNLIYAADLASVSSSGAYSMALMIAPGGQLDAPSRNPVVARLLGTPDCNTGKIKFSGASQETLETLNAPGIQERLQFSFNQWQPTICGRKGSSYPGFSDPTGIVAIYRLFDKPDGGAPMGFTRMTRGWMSFFTARTRTSITQIIFEAKLARGSYLEADREINCATRSVSQPKFFVIDSSGGSTSATRPEWVAGATADDALLAKWSCDNLQTISIAANFEHVEAAFRQYVAP